MTSTPLTGSKAFAGTDQDMTDLLAWAASAYHDLIQQLFNVTWGTPTYVPISPTNAQIGTALATATMNAWQAAVVKFKKDASVAAVATPAQMSWA
jgi:hypothetical protein